MLRSAGFPVEGLLRLGFADLAAAADAAASPACNEDDFGVLWERRIHDLQARLLEIARSDEFQAAVAWQNLHVVETALEPLLRGDGSRRDAKRRRRERLVSMYWQRYCAKNDTIGFFGPGAWGTLAPRRPATAVAAGRSLTRSSTVYFEHWAIDAIARRLQDSFDLGPWLAPRRAPFLRLDGTCVRIPGRDDAATDDLAAAILGRADGSAPAGALVRALASELDGVSADSVYERLEALRRARWVVWQVEIPPDISPERHLRGLLERIEDDAIREEAVAALTRLEAARARVAAVERDPRALRVALGDLEREFVEVTGRHARRRAGKTYGGRTLTFLECVRDVELVLGADFVDALAPIELLLHGARWLTWRTRCEVEPSLVRAYDEVAGRSGGDVRASDLWFGFASSIRDEIRQAVGIAVAELQEKLALLLLPGSASRRVAHTSTELCQRALEAFAAPSAGWGEARFASPDVLVAACEGQIAGGDFELVLGELHPAMNSTDYQSLLPMHDSPEDVLAWLDAVCPSPRLLTALPKESPPRLTARTHPALIRDRDVVVAMTPHAALPSRGTIVNGADAVVFVEGGTTRVGVGELVFDGIDLFAEMLKAALLDQFSLFAGSYTPRITVDRVVVARERWTFPTATVGFPQLPRERDRYTTARRWAAEAGLPRHVFVKSPVELKPFYVDLASPVYVDVLATLLARLARSPGGSSFQVTEMLPGPDRMWLHDRNGRVYASELRLVAVSDVQADGVPALGTDAR